MNVLQHVMQDGGHLDEMSDVTGGNLPAAGLHALSHSHHQVAYALQVGNAFQASQQLAGFPFIDAGDGAGQLLVDTPLNLV